VNYKLGCLPAKTYANHGSGLLDDHEPRPVTVFDVSAEGTLDHDDVLPKNSICVLF